jgi:hypothetical protein
MRSAALALLLIVANGAGAAAGPPPFRAGVVCTDVADAAPFAVYVWYSTEAAEGVWQVGPWQLAAANGVPVAAGQRFPVVLFSHGGGRGGGNPLLNRGLAAGRAREGAWFRIRLFWVTQGARKPPACGGRISVGRVSCAGGNQLPRVKLAGAEAVPGQAGSASADGLDPSSTPAGFCPGARHVGCARSGGGSGRTAAGRDTSRPGGGAG